jgi:hypothetical protein
MSTDRTRTAWLEPLHLYHVLVAARGDPPVPGLTDMLGTFWTEADLLAAVAQWAGEAQATFRDLFTDPVAQAQHYAAILTTQVAREAWHALIGGARLPPGHRWTPFPHRFAAYLDGEAEPLPLALDTLPTAQAAAITLVVCWTCGERLLRPAARHGPDCFVCAAEWIDTCRAFAVRHRNG